jgi:hypothetical protein
MVDRICRFYQIRKEFTSIDLHRPYKRIDSEANPEREFMRRGSASMFMRKFTEDFENNQVIKRYDLEAKIEALKARLQLQEVDLKRTVWGDFKRYS